MPRVTVGTSVAPLITNKRTAKAQVTVNNHGTVSVYVDTDNSVTTSTGYEIPAAGQAQFDLQTGEILYAISGTAAQRVDVLLT